MQRILCLNGYIKIICERSFDMAEQDFCSEAYEARMNSATEEFLSLAKDGQEEKAADYLHKNAEYIYDLGFRRRYAPDLESEERTWYTVFYRGVCDKAYPLVSGIYRKDEKHEENYYFNQINVQCPEYFRHLSSLEKLACMQHYGCPTRLLDITANPLVALYFACQGGADKEGIVYVFGVKTDKILYSGSDRALMLSTLAEFRRSDQRKLRLLAYQNILGGKFSQNSNQRYKNTILEQYFHAIKHHNSAFDRDIIPFDMLCPQFVQPYKDNPRILKQDGAFIMSGLDENDEESNFKIRKYLVDEIVVPPECKNKILDELKYVGINQATLFPEVDKVAEYLRR